MWEVDKGTFISRLIDLNPAYKVYYVRDDNGYPVYCITGNMNKTRSDGIIIPYGYDEYKFYMIIQTVRIYGQIYATNFDWTIIRNDRHLRVPDEYVNIINAYLDHLEWGINYAMQWYNYKTGYEYKVQLKWDVFNDFDNLLIKLDPFIQRYTDLFYSLFYARIRLGDIRKKSTDNFSLEFVPIRWS